MNFIILSNSGGLPRKLLIDSFIRTQRKVETGQKEVGIIIKNVTTFTLA